MICYSGPISELMKRLRLLEQFMGKSTKVVDINYQFNFPKTNERKLYLVK